jgi:Ca2+-binding RTX toxin-like protein
VAPHGGKPVGRRPTHSEQRTIDAGPLAIAQTDGGPGRETKGRRRWGASLVALVAGAALISFASPPGAFASTAAKTGPTLAVLSYTAEAGESNDVTVSLSGGAYTILDPGATITAGAGCSSVNANEVTCSATGITRINVKALDGDDSLGIDDSVGTTPARLDGGPGDDVVVGGPGNDFVIGGPGNPPDGNDTLDGGLGDDGISGGAGVDTLTYATRTAAVMADLRDCCGGVGGQTNIDEVDDYRCSACGVGGFVDFENITGGSGNDTLIGTQSANVLKGGPGADNLRGDLGVDTVDYSDRATSVSVTIGNNGTASAGDDGNASDGPAGARDNVQSDVENVLGGAGNDTLVGSDPFFAYDQELARTGQNRLRGGPGDDTLDGKLGPDVLQGDGGTDTLTYGDRTGSVTATIDGAADDGGAEDIDPISLRRDNILDDVENVIGGAGDDVLTGDGDGNALEGGLGDDSIDGGGGNDSLSGGGGNDALQGAAGDDALNGGEDNDVMNGGSGGDALDGGSGDDNLDGGTGADALIGGDGTDVADYSAALTPVSVNPNGAADDGVGGEGDNVAGDVESANGGADDDTLIGNGGNGVLNGGDGNDVLDGGGGADTLIGGAGLDAASYASRTGAVAVDLSAPGGDGEAGENDNVTSDVEKVVGGAAGDTLTGDANPNVLSGGAGGDTLSGGGGSDGLIGGADNDTLSGGDGSDVLSGDDGKDTLRGDADSDSLNGGTGDDSLDGGAGADIISGGDDNDTAVYAARSRAVRVSIGDAANDGESREGDFVMSDVEGVSTGSGNDWIDSVDGAAGDISCGRGEDTVNADADDDVAADCEVVNVSALGRCSVSRRSATVTMTRSGAVGIRVTCPISAKGSVRLLRSGRAFSRRKSFSVRAGASKTVKLKLTRKARRTVRRRNRLRVEVSVVARARGTGASARTKATRRVTIKEPKSRRKR